MEIKDMDISRLLREKICLKRQIATLQSTIKQIETEIEKRYDEERL